jgi:integrase
VGHSYKRLGKDGKPRYTAIYKDFRGQRRSAGTFTARRDADKAWQRAESRTTFADYVTETWLPNHQIEVTTRERYTGMINKYLIPEFGGMRLVDIMSADIRSWITALKQRGASANTIADNKTVLSAIFTTALNDQRVHIHPCRGVKSPPVPKKARIIVTSAQFETIYESLPDEQSRLLVETDIESGLRWGELTELRPRDLHASTRMLTVSRAVVNVSPEFHPDGGRFLVKYPKDQEYRKLKLSPQIVLKLRNHIQNRGLGSESLIFAMPADDDTPSAHLRLVTEEEPLGRTPPNRLGRTYRHGMTGYSLGGCRCDYCRDSFRHYRAERRAQGMDDPRTPRTVDTDGHIPRWWFRAQIWRPALTAARLDFNVRVQDMRHAHASWLLAGGADLQMVKERMGHGTIRTTERYLHTLPDADDAALDALRRIRDRAIR